MKSAHLSANGPAENVVKCIDVPDPGAPGEGEVLVDIVACSINPADILLIEGNYASVPDTPCPLGIEGAGTVAAVGSGVSNLKAGDKVMSLARTNWVQQIRDNAGAFIRLPAELTKEKKQKSVPINRHVKKVLDSLPRALHHGYVFTYGGKPISIRFRRALMKACEKAGVIYAQNVEGGMRFHDIRTTFKTNMLRAGVDPVMRDVIVGHSLKGMDAFYLKPTDEDLREAMDKYTGWFDARIANVTQNVTQRKVRGRN